MTIVDLSTEDLLPATPSVITIIPAFNEGASIAAVVKEVATHVPEADIVVIDDGSTDDTAAMARAAGATVLSTPVNLGIGAAVQTGLLWASRGGYEVVIRVDGDGQHDLSHAKDMMQPIIDRSADVVIGSRFLGGDVANYRPPPLRRAGIAIFSWLLRLGNAGRFTDPTSGYRCLNHDAVSVGAAMSPHDYPEIESVFNLTRRGYRVIEVPVLMRERQGGRSSIMGRKTVYYALSVLLGMSLEATRGRRSR